MRPRTAAASLHAMTLRLPLLLCATLLAGCAGTRPAPAPPPAAVPAVTGVASCDAYLAGYQACHQAAAIFPATQLPTQYQAMRDSLLEAARDPHARAYLDARCRLLAGQERQALQGRPCTAH